MNRCFNTNIRLCPTCGDGSGNYVDDIPSISHNLVSALKESDTTKFSTFFSTIKDAAYIKFLKDIELKFNETKSFNHIIAETKPFSIDRKHTLYSDEHKLIGYYVLLPYHQFVDYTINKLGMYVHQAGEIELHVIDLVTNTVIKQSTYKVTKGINNVKINFTVENDYQTELFVAIKATTAVLSSMKCEELKDSCNCGCLDECYDCLECDECGITYGELQPCEVYEKKNIQRLDIKHFCLDATMKCSFERMICEYAEYFEEAYKYLVGLFILKHKINSYERGWYTDANVQTITDVTMPEMEEYYHRLLSLSISTIKDITNDSICWSCNGLYANNPMMSSFI
jgi:hypothetical protein